VRNEIEAALVAWREAIRRVEGATDGDRDALQAEADRAGAEFQRISANHMMRQIDALHDAEDRRKSEVPSTPPFHEAAREEKRIAAEIWDTARASDEEAPRQN
jgi:hypothetical protein